MRLLLSPNLRRTPRHLVRRYTAPNPLHYPMDILLSELSRRISHLEWQIEHLRHTQRRLQHTHTVLCMNETFRRFHRHLSEMTLMREKSREDRREDARIQRVLGRYRLTIDDIQKTLELTKTRNGMAHPRDEPDLTDVDLELTRVYAKVRRLLQDHTLK